jgi:small conductance mechanosensitive channel
MSASRTLAPPDWEAIATAYTKPLIDGAPNVAAAAVIFVVGLFASDIAARGVRRLAERNPNVDTTLGVFFASIVRYGILAFVILAVLNRFGVQTASLIAVMGAATLAIGFALQGALSNVAAGVMLVLFRPYRIGEFVEVAGRQGFVRDVTLFTTELATQDNVKIILPNALCWGAPIVNYSAHALRRVDVELLLANGADLEKASDVIIAAARADPRVRGEPAPNVAVLRFGEKTVTVALRAWAASFDHAELQPALARRAKDALDDAGVPRGVP